MYTVKELARLTGLTPRTLRYYDNIGLLRTQRNDENDYRLYGPAEIDRLQQILLYRNLGLPLEEIRRILDAPGFDRVGALREHLKHLTRQKSEIEGLIRSVQGTLDEIEGGFVMSDQKKFEDLKQQAVRENEAVYGREAREKYGNQAVDAHNAKVMNMPREEWDAMKQQEEDCKAALRRAVETGDLCGEAAREAVRLHAAWLAHYWPEGAVTPQAHIGMAEMYVQDQRFASYYDAVVPGGAVFFEKAVKAFYQG